MGPARTQKQPQRRSPAQTKRFQGQARPGRRFTRKPTGSAGGGRPRMRRQPEPGRAQKLMGMVRGAMPGGAKRKGGGLPVVGRLFAGKRRRRSGRGRAPAMLGLFGAGAAGAAMAARRRKGAETGAEPPTEPETATTPPRPPEQPAAGDG